MNKIPLAAALVLLSAAAASAQISDDEPAIQGVSAAPKPAAKAKAAACNDGITVKWKNKFCESVDDCVTFCECACDFDATKFSGKGTQTSDGSITCDKLPAGGTAGGVDKDKLLDATSLTYVEVDPKTKATQEMLDHLTALNTQLTSSANRQSESYKVRVKNCYRPFQNENERLCRLVLGWKGKADAAEDDKTKEDALKWADPRNHGLVWPGGNPHSSGVACDIVLIDSAGTECFGCKANDSKKLCSMSQKDASEYLVDELTSTAVGASRLTFEAWHFAWAKLANESLCTGDGCDSYWPVTCKPGNK
jgi:hypothetical protein